MHLDWQTIATIIGGISTLLAVIVSLRTAHAQQITAKASAKKDDYEAQQHVIDNLRDGYDRMRTENRELRQEVAELRQDYEALSRQYDDLKARYADVCAWAKLRGYTIKPAASA